MKTPRGPAGDPRGAGDGAVRALRRAPGASLLVLAGIALALPLTTGCQSLKDLYADALLEGDVISYPQYLSVETEGSERPTVDQVLERLGEPARIYRREGKRRKVVYNAYSLNDDLRKAEFYFDENEVVMKKQLW